MTYIVLYIAGIASIWWAVRVGFPEALKTVISIVIPSALIILFNAKAGRLLFRNPLVGVISVLPTAVFIYKASQPLVAGINTWVDQKTKGFVDYKDVVDVEVVSKEDG